VLEEPNEFIIYPDAWLGLPLFIYLLLSTPKFHTHGGIAGVSSLNLDDDVTSGRRYLSGEGGVEA
jgi:hypothetical protein